MEAKLLVFIAIACTLSRIEGQTITQVSSINITRSGCGTSKLCFPTCDPVANSSTCYFGSSQLNTTLFFELRGPSSGYVALGLASDPNVGATIVFVCASDNSTNSNSSFFFKTASNTSTGLTLTNVSTVYTVQGAVNQNSNQSHIQCTFNTSSTLNVSTTAKASATISYYVTIFSGTTSGTSLGSPISVYYSQKALNLADPTSNTNTTTSSTTVAATAAPTTGGSDSLTNPVAHALAILLSAMGLLLLS